MKNRKAETDNNTEAIPSGGSLRLFFTSLFPINPVLIFYLFTTSCGFDKPVAVFTGRFKSQSKKARLFT